jgi:hypothetical protein
MSRTASIRSAAAYHRRLDHHRLAFIWRAELQFAGALQHVEALKRAVHGRSERQKTWFISTTQLPLRQVRPNARIRPPSLAPVWMIGKVVMGIQRVLADRPDAVSATRRRRRCGCAYGSRSWHRRAPVDAAVDGEAGIIERRRRRSLPAKSILIRLEAVISSNICHSG